jgi:hypothetical protein
MDNKKQQEKYLYSFEATDAASVKRKFCILKPTRKMKENGELFYASKLSQFISAGVLPKIVWDKIFKDNGGIISEVDQKEYSDLFVEFSEFRNSVDNLSVKSEKERTEDEKNQIEFFEGQLIRVRKRMQEMEMAQVNAFENTAEAKARNRTIVWWAANLAAEENKGIVELLLGSGQIEDRLDIYDSIIENDKFLTDCFSRINYLVTVWYLGSASSFEDFKSLDEEYLKRIQEDESLLKPDDNSLEDKSRGEKENETVAEVDFKETEEINQSVSVVADK